MQVTFSPTAHMPVQSHTFRDYVKQTNCEHLACCGRKSTTNIFLQFDSFQVLPILPARDSPFSPHIRIPTIFSSVQFKCAFPDPPGGSTPGGSRTQFCLLAGAIIAEFVFSVQTWINSAGSGEKGKFSACNHALPQVLIFILRMTFSDKTQAALIIFNC